MSEAGEVFQTAIELQKYTESYHIQREDTPNFAN